MKKKTRDQGHDKDNGKYIKCVVWDLDNTLWDGVLLEGDNVKLREDVKDIIKKFDSRGILLSIASKNDHGIAMEKLKEFGLHEMFLYPQINWNPKSFSIREIAKSINIGLDTIAFIDDQIFEREEVSYSAPDVLCIDARKIDQILDMPEMKPRFITTDSKLRRKMYLNDIRRKKDEEESVGTQEDFLAGLDMTFNISIAKEEDLKRAEELTVRTNQLNATGYTYSYDELNYFRQSKDHKLLIASLDDKYGTYGKIGLALVEQKKDTWTIKLLLMSCRVMSRGVGMIMVNHIMNMAKQKDVRLLAEFVTNERNRMMYVTYKFAGFKEIRKSGEVTILENDLARIQSFPDYVKVIINGNYRLADLNKSPKMLNAQ